MSWTPPACIICGQPTNQRCLRCRRPMHRGEDGPDGRWMKGPCGAEHDKHHRIRDIDPFRFHLYLMEARRE